MRQVSYLYHVVEDAFYTFLADDGWAIASHIALSTLMALFPFLIVLFPLMLEAARRHIPFFVETNEHFLNVTRYSVTIGALPHDLPNARRGHSRTRLDGGLPERPVPIRRLRPNESRKAGSMRC